MSRISECGAEVIETINERNSQPGSINVMAKLPEISVCVCTYQRPESLRRLISQLEQQRTDNLFSFHIIIVDNDAEASARAVVEDVARGSTIDISYHVEREQNIALARNRAVANATGDAIAFIDDDEIPGPDWLARLYVTQITYCADGVLGPVRPRFESTPPRWVLRGGVFDRPECPTGAKLEWRNTRTGNVLVRRQVLQSVEGPFRPEFGRGGEDRDFFRRAIGAGFVFVGCEEAAIEEVISPERMRVSTQLRRALLRGKQQTVDSNRLVLLKSLLACVGYTLLLPFLCLAGRHLFVKYLIKDFDHLGALIACFGADVVKQRYVVR